MQRLGTIHPSAPLFAAILLSLLLPFGNAVESCGSASADFSAVEVLTGSIEPNPSGPGLPVSAADQRFADEVEQAGWPFAAMLAGLGLIGLVLTTLAGGRLWGTCCALIAIDTIVLAFAVNLGDAHAGFHVAFWGSAAGALIAFCLTLNRWVERRRARLAANDTTPELPLLR
jgi:hypothetical protein